MPSRIPSIALRMPWAMFLNASSLFVHVVTGRRSIGSPWSVWSDRGTISRRLGTRNRLCQPKSLLALSGDVGAEPISQASSLDEPLIFERRQPVPHILNRHLGGSSHTEVLDVILRIPLEVQKRLKNQPFAAFKFHVRFSFDWWVYSGPQKVDHSGHLHLLKLFP